MHLYDVMLGNETVGSAEIKYEGLYCKVLCICKLRLAQIYRVKVVGTSGELLLGVCVPEGDKWVLERRLPAKYFPSKELQFYIMGEEKEKTVVGMAVEEKTHFKISGLRNMRYCISGGQRMLISQL